MSDVLMKITFNEKGSPRTIQPLDRKVYISPKSAVEINPPMTVEYFTETVSVRIGIGPDHTAELIMDKDAWEAMKSGEELSITTVKELKKQSK